MKKIVLGMAALAVLGSCQRVAGWFGNNDSKDSTQQTMSSESAHKAKVVRDESITRENAYSDLFLDSAAVESYIKTKNLSGEDADKLRDFYLVRNNQFAWFSSTGITEQGRGLWGLYNSEDKAGKKEYGALVREKMDSLLANDSVQFSAADTSLAQTELTLTAQLVQLASENKNLVNADNYLWLVPRKKMAALEWADSLLNRQKDSSLGQNNAVYAALKESLNRYYTAAKNGGWDTMAVVAGLRKGSKSPAVKALKKRLAATADYTAADTSTLFTDSLVTAIKAVQEQYGFVPSGRVTDSLIEELNRPAEERVQQILVNMNRVLWMPQQQDSNEIMINIPSLELVVYRGDTAPPLSMPVIVGKEGTGTIAFRDQITEVVFSPYWNIPKSIVQREIRPAMQQDPDYLKKKHMEIVKQNDSLPQIRQLPGKDNALGRVKFLFPNSFDIYLHDTPNKDLFAQKNRALSHGCIRVAEPDSLAQYVLRGQPEWTPEKIAAAMNSGREQKAGVRHPVPVAITYYTAWTDKKGKLNFRRDVYGYDQKAAAKLFTSTTLPVASPA